MGVMSHLSSVLRTVSLEKVGVMNRNGVVKWKTWTLHQDQLWGDTKEKGKASVGGQEWLHKGDQ